MPLFEYRCTECDEKFEKLVYSSQTEPVKCDNCGSEQTEKLFSTFASAGFSGSSASSAASGCGCGSSSGFT